jgi:hypothetical protein
MPPTVDSTLPSTIPFRGWLRATWFGWLLGIPVIILFALAGEMMGVGGSQVFVGAGLGAALAIFQGRAIAPLGVRPIAWRISCVFGLAVPFLAYDIATLFGAELAFSLPIAATAGGALVGVWQALLLRDRVRGAPWWIPVTTVGWALAAVAVYAADHLVRGTGSRGVSGALLFLVLVAAGGLLLGAVTGTALSQMTRSR